MSEVSEALDRLVTEVEETKGVVESTKTFIAGLKQQLLENAGNAAKIREIANTLDSVQTDLGSAIETNPGPTPEPEPQPEPQPGDGGSTGGQTT